MRDESCSTAGTALTLQTVPAWIPSTLCHPPSPPGMFPECVNQKPQPKKKKKRWGCSDFPIFKVKCIYTLFIHDTLYQVTR